MKGESWNESEVFSDVLTLRTVRVLAVAGLFNSLPTYHTRTAFTEDGDYLLFAAARHGRSMLCRARTSDGLITALTGPVDGVGGRAEQHVLLSSRRGVLGNGRGIANIAMAPRSRQAVYTEGKSLRLVNIDTLTEKTLIGDIGRGVPGQPSIDPDEKYALIPLNPPHPEVEAGKRVTMSYAEAFSLEGMKMELLRVPLAGGGAEAVYGETGVNCFHAQYCPSDCDIVLIDRNYPAGHVEKGSRARLLHVPSGELRELAPHDENRHQVHSTWTWGGEHVVYHGHGKTGGWYIGVIGKDGKVLREYHFPRAKFYGHVSAMAGRPAIILDGNLAEGLLLLLYYKGEKPVVEILARHGSDFLAMPWQYAHPHAQSDKSGKYVAFNSSPREWGTRAQSRLCLLEV